MNLSMFLHECLAVLVVCTLGGWAPLFERSWVQFSVSLAKSKKKCFSIALRHTLVVLEMH